MLRRNCYIALCCFIPLFIFCQRDQKAGDPKPAYTRITLGPAISFYSGNTQHTTNTRSGASFFGNISEEVRMYKDIFFVGGLEYQYSPVTFNSYYLTSGYPNLYNGHYDYNYKLALQEGRLNLLLRLIGGDELKNTLTSYLEAGYVLRYLINTNLKVTNDNNGKVEYEGVIHPTFNGAFMKNSFSSGIKINAGLQHNFLRSHRAWYIQLGFMIGLTPFLIQESFTPSSLYLKSSYLQIGFGYKF